MSDFAKLFEREGQQVLLFKDKDDDGDPAIKVVFETERGNRCTLAFGYAKSAARDIAFDGIDESDAFDIVDDATKGIPL